MKTFSVFLDLFKQQVSEGEVYLGDESVMPKTEATEFFNKFIEILKANFTGDIMTYDEELRVLFREVNEALKENKL
jgi:hypothetical protein